MLLSSRLVEIRISLCEFRESGIGCTYRLLVLNAGAIEARCEVSCFGLVKKPGDMWLLATEKGQESKSYRKYK